MSLYDIMRRELDEQLNVPYSCLVYCSTLCCRVLMMSCYMDAIVYKEEQHFEHL